MIGRLPWFGLLGLVMLAPLPFGMVPPLATALAALWLVILLVAWGGLAAAGRVPVFWHAALWVPAMLYAAVLGWVILQAHWPTEPDGLLRDAAAVLHRPVPATLSTLPAEMPSALLMLAIPAAVFWLVVNHARDPRYATEALVCVVVSQAAYALYGLVDYIAGNTMLLWYPRWAYPGDVTGTLVNRNNYATLAGMGLLAAYTMARVTSEARWHAVEATGSGAARVLAIPGGRVPLYLFALAIIAMAWLQSHSRMGFVATLLGLIVMLALEPGGKRSRWMRLGLAVAIGAMLLAVSGTGTLDRIDNGDGGERAPILATAWRAVLATPWTGSGAGAFPDAFAAVRDESLPQLLAYDMAHNSYLHAAVDLGVPAAAALVLTAFWLVGLCVAGVFRRRRDRVYPLLGVGVGVLVGTHSLLDFSIQIPADAILFAALLGVGVAQSFPGSVAPPQ